MTRHASFLLTSRSLLKPGHNIIFFANPTKQAQSQSSQFGFNNQNFILGLAMKNTTDSQKQASRENGSKSHGPVTPEGKQRVSQNARRHGLFCKAIVADNERRENFTIVIRKFKKYYKPDGAVEEAFVQEMAACYWRLRRAWAVENRLLNREMPDSSNPDMGLVPPPPIDDENEYVEEMDRLANSYERVAQNPGFKFAVQFQSRLSRDYKRAFHGLKVARRERRAIDRAVELLNMQNKPENSVFGESDIDNQINDIACLMGETGPKIPFEHGTKKQPKINENLPKAA